ncbi:pitrilysin family protein [Massilia sp. BSC265]|uniref:M16 family metallopeptidase n=1 Tax=Massilia sp. BSC265 TaxID=1549812 RepID=UPI0004E93B32|nr:pitrilysin family protein [Massilia sp. BSC265]KFI05977.1 peptidase M16 [Massilia sp. BSC265]
MRYFRLLALLLIMTTFAPPSGAQTAPPSLPTVAFEKTTLPNGLQLILVEDRRLPIVAVNIWYHVGPANEAPGLTGFAHLFEHMMFAQTRHIPRGMADRLLEGAGATDSNGGTGYDQTSYYDTVPSNQLELALWVHADRMGYLLDVLDQKALANQQDVVRNERRETVEDEPYGLVQEALAHALFPKGHPYYASIIGSHADIQNAKLEDVREFFRRYYGPNNASLVIAGDIDKAKTRALVERYFGSLRRSLPVARPSVTTPPITSERRVVVHDRVELPRVFMGWLTPPAYQEGDAELAVAAEILAGGKSSRLYKKLVYERQIAQDVDASQNSQGLASTFVIDVTARPGHEARELEEAIDAELAQLREHGPSQREVERARNSLETALLSTIEKLGGDGLADQLNHYNQYTGDPGYLTKDLARLRSITPGDVQRAVRGYLRQQARAVVTGLPGKPVIDDPRIPPAPKKSKAAKAGTAAETEAINPPEPWRAQQPKAGPAPRFTLPQGESFKLANGLTVIHHYKQGLPLVSAQLVVRSGSADNPANLPGLAGFTAQMLEEGTATRSAPQIADEIAQLGAFLDTGTSVDASVVSLLALRGTFAPALDVLADIVLRPAFPTAEVERQRADRVGELIQQRDDPEAVASVAAAGALYGNRHPKGHGQLGTEPAIRAATRDDLVAFWRRHYVPGNAALVVSGDISRGELKALAESRFTAWPRADVPDGGAGEPAGTRARLVMVDQPGAVQTALRVTGITVARTTPDFPALQVLNAALGGMFSSRLNNNLRETKGYTYGISSYFRYDRTPGPFVIAGSVRRDATGDSVREIFRELGEIRDAPLPAAELDAARDAQVLSLPGAFETNADIGASLAEIFVYGLPLDYYARLPGQLNAVTAAQVQAAARKHLAPERMTVVAVGDRKRMLPQLQALGMGAVEVRDSDGQLPRPRQ